MYSIKYADRILIIKCLQRITLDRPFPTNKQFNNVIYVIKAKTFVLNTCPSG